MTIGACVCVRITVPDACLASVYLASWPYITLLLWLLAMELVATDPALLRKLLFASLLKFWFLQPSDVDELFLLPPEVSLIGMRFAVAYSPAKQTFVLKPLEFYSTVGRGSSSRAVALLLHDFDVIEGCFCVCCELFIFTCWPRPLLGSCWTPVYVLPWDSVPGLEGWLSIWLVSIDAALWLPVPSSGKCISCAYALSLPMPGCENMKFLSGFIDEVIDLWPRSLRWAMLNSSLLPLALVA